MKRHALFAVVAIAACGRTAHEPKSTAVALPPSVASVSSTAVAVDPCPAIEAHLRSELRGRVRDLGDAGPTWGEPWTDKTLLAAIPSSGLGCIPFRGGAWIVLADEKTIDLSQSNEISAHVHFSVALAGQRSKPWGDVYVGYGGEPTTMKRWLVTDYDGDGVPELYVRTDEDGVEGGHFAETWILSVRHDAEGAVVEPLAAAAKLGEIGDPTDVDGDGRLDLPVSLGLGLIASGDCSGKDDVAPAKFLAHSLPNGAFSIDDAVARSYAMTWCPARPVRIATPSDALCARLRASTPAEITAERARVKASCVAWDCAREQANLPQPTGADRACRGRLESFPDDVPLRL